MSLDNFGYTGCIWLQTGVTFRPAEFQEIDWAFKQQAVIG